MERKLTPIEVKEYQEAMHREFDKMAQLPRVEPAEPKPIFEIVKRGNSMTELDPVWQRFQDMEEKFPATDKSIPWRCAKVLEEATETYWEMSTVPTPELALETTDVLITVLWLQKKMGITPAVSIQMLMDKMDILDQRYSTGYYDTNPDLKNPREQTVFVAEYDT